MKRLFFYLLLVIIISACQSPNDKPSKYQINEELKYDSVLANKYGADKYGMKHYVIAFLKRGPNRIADSSEAAQLQKAHLDNIVRLADEGKLIIAGPFLDNEDIRGIYIFNVKTIEEAKKLTETDPAIQKGSLAMELHPWYGSAALMAIPDMHKKLEKKSVAE